jgi:excinuclease UvrABC helicase subunit UvrB
MGPGKAETPPPFIVEIDGKIAQAIANKDAALDEGDMERAIQYRSEERRLLEEKASREGQWKSAAHGIDERIAETRRKKEGAIDEQDFERAARLRDEERKLLNEKGSLWRGTGLDR